MICEKRPPLPGLVAAIEDLDRRADWPIVNQFGQFLLRRTRRPLAAFERRWGAAARQLLQDAARRRMRDCVTLEFAHAGATAAERPGSCDP